MNTLLIAEKPSVALRLAIALGENTQKRTVLNGVSYYELETKEGKMFIVAAVGHLYTLRQASKERGYPVLDVEWVASYKANPKADYTKKYLNVFESIAPRCDSFINACDFDIEGSVIGTNIIKFACGVSALEKSKRMKFSTTTIPDLKESFANLMPLDKNNFYAGETRHMLDWLWGINLSRALTSALVGSRFIRALSIGRVQGPALALLAKKEQDIQKFVPKPYWKIAALVHDVEFLNKRGNIIDKGVADSALAETIANMQKATVSDATETEQMLRPLPPFDLTTLQVEASKIFHLDPSMTLSIAQSLYEKSYISYPRTSSQKLPPTLGLQRIITELAKNAQFAELAKALIESRRFKPNEGAKTDEAHPAIYPTGVIPKVLSPIESKVYTLIVHRFLSCFAPYAKLARTRVEIVAGKETYAASGTRIIERGWLGFYNHVNVSDKMLPQLKKGDQAGMTKAYTQDFMTQPPRRFSKAGLISELERRNLGTKATRAGIIDTLFRRGYVEGVSIKTTNFGMAVYEALSENAPMIMDEATTHKLDDDMEKISKGEKRASDVVEDGKRMLLDALKIFDRNKSKIAVAMKVGITESEQVLGKCPKCGGNLVIRHSRAGKQFAACANYPKCTNTYSLPQYAKIVPLGKVCEHCHTPIVKVIRKGKGVFEMDLDPDCITKAKWKAKQEAKAATQASKPMTGATPPEKTSAKKGKASPKSATTRKSPTRKRAAPPKPSPSKKASKPTRKKRAKKTKENAGSQ